MGFSRKGYWSELPFPPPGNLPHPGIKPTSPALQADSLTSGPPSCVKSARAGRSKLTAGPSVLSWRSLCVLRSTPALSLLAGTYHSLFWLLPCPAPRRDSLGPGGLLSLQQCHGYTDFKTTSGKRPYDIMPVSRNA